MSETTQIILGVVGSNAMLVGVIVFLAKKFGPDLFTWMRAKIDVKNGEIGQLVEQTRKLVQTILELTENSNKAQDEFLCELRTERERERAEIQKLIELVRAAAERAA